MGPALFAQNLYRDVMRILIACDKFKGTLSAAQANAAIARALVNDKVQCQAIADGGEGTAALLGEARQASVQTAEVDGPLGEKVIAQFWLTNNTEPNKRLAIFDMSAASGLQLLANADRDPWQASTYGTGQLLLAAQAAGADRLLLGLGGSATNDGGAGLACALGFQFYDANHTLITDVPSRLNHAAELRAPSAAVLPQIKVTALSDVNNPLLGPQGATQTFGAQKGIQAGDQERQEQRLAHLAHLTTQCLGSRYEQYTSAGAAGGLGFGLMSFAQATVESGFERLAVELELDRLVQQSDLVLTGEGSLDAQSLHGKGPGALAALAKQHQKPCIALCGRTDNSAALNEHFVQVLPLVRNNAAPPADSAAALTALTSAHRATWSNWG